MVYIGGMERDIILIAHNLRSCHNVGSLLRTADGLGVKKVILCGYTPYPAGTADRRLPHESAKITRQIHKTALGAEDMVPWSHADGIFSVIRSLQDQGYLVCALEQGAGSTPLPSFKPPHKLAVILGREVEGVEPEVLAATDMLLEIPMSGQKESFNVVQAAAMALYHCRFA
jgi:tRNA G18 (ribose-2'-O)-methylase SpoU